MILLTNGTTSYSVFLYGSMNWGTLVLSGFNNGTDFYSLAGGANSTQRMHDATVLQFSSNVGVDGVFIFRTDSSKCFITNSQTLCTYTLPVLLRYKGVLVLHTEVFVPYTIHVFVRNIIICTQQFRMECNVRCKVRSENKIKLVWIEALLILCI